MRSSILLMIMLLLLGACTSRMSHYCPGCFERPRKQDSRKPDDRTKVSEESRDARFMAVVQTMGLTRAVVTLDRIQHEADWSFSRLFEFDASTPERRDHLREVSLFSRELSDTAHVMIMTLNEQEKAMVDSLDLDTFESKVRTATQQLASIDAKLPELRRRCREFQAKERSLFPDVPEDRLLACDF